MKKIGIIPALLITVGAGFGIGMFTARYIGVPVSRAAAIGGNGKGQAETWSAATPAGRERVVALGRLEPEGGVISLSSPVPEQLGSIEVKEGQQVKKGEVVAYLESRSERQAELELAQTQFAEAKKRRAAVERHAQSLVDEAKLRIDQLTPLDNLNVKAQAAKVNAAREQLQNAQTNLRRLQRLKEGNSGTISQQEVDHQTLLVQQAQAELEASQAVLDRLREAQSSNLASAKANYQTALASRERYLQEIPLDSLEKSVRLAQTRLSRTALLAPRDGTVLKVLVRPGEAVGGRPILRLGQTDRLEVIAEVYETDIRHVALAQTVTVTCDALPQVSAKGKVVQVGNMIGKNRLVDLDPTATTDARVVEVKIRLDDCQGWDKLINMQVQVCIACSGQDPPLR